MASDTGTRTGSLVIAQRLLAICGFLLSPAVAAGQGGGLTFLNLPPGADGLGAGSAHVADARGALSSFWNPAGLAEETNSVAFSFQSWVESVQLLSLASQFDVGSKTNLGLFITAVSSGDLEARQQPGDPDGTFSAQFMTVGAAVARSFGPVRVGLTGKLLSERIFSYTSNGAAFDFGLQSSLFQDRMRVGAALQHVGSMEQLATESTELPRTIRGGISAKLLTLTMEDDDETLVTARISVDASKRSTEDDVRFHVGATAGVFDFLVIRGGVITGDEILKYSVGLGLDVSSFVFDFAFLPFQDGFGGSSQVLSLHYDW